MRQILDDSAAMNRKEKNMARLIERYNGKKDLLAEWEPFSELDPDYLRDLKRRVRVCENDITYRGGVIHDADL